MENNTVVTDDEKPVEEVATSETTTETTEKTTTEIASEDAKSVYEKELEKLETEKRQKEGALKEERRLRKEAEAAKKAAEDKLAEQAQGDKPLTTKELDKRLSEELTKRDFDQSVRGYTADPKEQELIKHHYDNSIRKTGDVATDLKMAVAIANQHLVDQAKRVQIERENAEAQNARFTGGQSYGRTGKPAYESDPRLKGAAALLDKIGAGDAKKFL